MGRHSGTRPERRWRMVVGGAVALAVVGLVVALHTPAHADTPDCGTPAGNPDIHLCHTPDGDHSFNLVIKARPFLCIRGRIGSPILDTKECQHPETPVLVPPTLSPRFPAAPTPVPVTAGDTSPVPVVTH
jgi:hypothetical protein